MTVVEFAVVESNSHYKGHRDAIYPTNHEDVSGFGHSDGSRPAGVVF